MSNLLDTNRRYCSVCQCCFNSEAELAMHEFSKRHCDNLIRLSKNKPVKSKVPKPEATKAVIKQETCDAVPQPVNVSLYGYFTSSDMLSSQPKEYNTEYDPYLQKLAENPYKATAIKEVPALTTTNVNSFSRSKRRKKKSCQICNVSMMNIPEYEAHMKSPQHIYNLKLSGMGVSAHFVKASTNLHTTEKEELGVSVVSTVNIGNSHVTPLVPISPAELFCDLCGVLLNSQQQFQAHLSGKTHLDNVQRKHSTHAPSPNRLFCYSCKLSLTNLLQYNEHKNGKKHRVKCKSLMREGITIPPEERPQDMVWNIVASAQTVYPEGYQQGVLDKQKLQNISQGSDSSIKGNETPLPENLCSTKTNIIFTKGKETESAVAADVDLENNEINMKNTPEFQCSLCKIDFSNQPPFEMHLNSEAHALNLVSLKKSGMTSDTILLKLMDDRKVIRPDKYHRFCCGICAIVSQNQEESEGHLRSLVHKYAVTDYTKKRRLEIVQSVEANDDKLYCCKCCNESWGKLTDYNAHLHSQNHKTLSWKEKQKKYKDIKWPYLKFQRLNSWRGNTNERNPGVRTKIGGIAKCLNSGTVEVVPNLEVIESKIDTSKNVNLGLSADSKKIIKMVPARRRPGMIYCKLPSPTRPIGTRQPYPPSLLMQPIAPPLPIFKPPTPSPGTSRYHPFSRPNYIQQYPSHRPFFRPMPPSQFSSWGPSYRMRRYY